MSKEVKTTIASYSVVIFIFAWAITRAWWAGFVALPLMAIIMAFKELEFAAMRGLIAQREKSKADDRPPPESGDETV